MDPDVIDDTLLDEAEILKYFKDNFTSNPKKLLKLAERVKPSCKPNVVAGLINSLLTVKNPVAYIKKCFVQINDYSTTIEQLLRAGHHGMLIIDDNGKDIIYPITLDTRENWLKSKWNPEDEVDIQHQAVVNWLKENNKFLFYGKVVLFQMFGFSGIPRLIRKTNR